MLKRILQTIFGRSLTFLLLTSTPVSVALICVFVNGYNESITAYVIYFLSAYCLASCVYSGIIAIRRAKISGLRFTYKSRVISKLRSSKLICRYLDSRHFRGEAGIYISLTADTLYTAFRAVTGIIYDSVWFLSLAAYHAVLALIRLYLAFSYRKAAHTAESAKKAYEYRRYIKTGILLLFLNIPMGGMILLMIHTNSGFVYPGYIIYLSAMYTFYTAITAVINIVRYRRLGSPVVSAAKALNLVSSAMSLLGLQTAMIAFFSGESDDFRMIMNTATGAGVLVITVSTAIYMIVRSVPILKNERAGKYDKIGE